MIFKLKNLHDDEHTTNETLLWDDYVLLSPAQDFVGGTACFCIYLTRRVTDQDGYVMSVREPFLITSNRELFPLTYRDLSARRMRLARANQVPADTNRWATGLETTNSVYAFIHGTANVEPDFLFEKIEGLFRRYLEYPDDLYYSFLTLWCIGTYLFMLFDSYPYVYLWGTSRAGKTRTMEIAEPLCFNSMMAASMSDAVLFRSADNDRSTLFYDEAARLKSRPKGNRADGLGIINSGYKRSGLVMRCCGGGNAPTFFSTYSPKMFAGIDLLDPIAADRTITLNFLRAKGKVQKLNYRRVTHEFAEIGNALYVFAMTYHREISEIYDNQDMVDGLQDREDEIWSPIFALARFFDAQRLDRSKEKAELLLDKMIRLALSCRDRKQAEDMENNLDERILSCVLEFTREYKPLSIPGRERAYYLSDHILVHANALEGLEHVTKNYLTRTLSKLNVLQYREYLRVNPCTGEIDRAQKQRFYYMIDPERLRDAAERYMGRGGNS